MNSVAKNNLEIIEGKKILLNDCFQVALVYLLEDYLISFSYIGGERYFIHSSIHQTFIERLFCGKYAITKNTKISRVLFSTSRNL